MATKRSSFNQKRMLWPDALRVVSVFLVVMIHISAEIVLAFNKVDTSQWIIGNFFDSLSRISVPLFIILSGSLLLHKTDNLKVFTQKRLNRILLPWLFWGSILLLLNNYLGYTEFRKENLKLLIINNYLSGFWFMPMIAGVYIITPFIKPFVQTAKKIEFIYFFTLWITIASILPMLNKIFNVSMSIYSPVWLSYLGYFIGGYVIAKKIKLKKEVITKVKILFLINLITITTATYQLTIEYNKFTDYIYDFLSLPVILMSFSAFIILKDCFQKNIISIKIKKIINYFNKSSFGILLIHILILKILKSGLLGFEFSILKFNPIIAIPIASAVLFIISGILISELQKIKILRKIVG